MNTKAADTDWGQISEKNRITMRAAIIDRYGPADVIKIEEIARPRCGPDEVLVAVRAASVNPYDWHNMRGLPLLVRIGGGWRKPKSRFLGFDVAGVVEAVGEHISEFSVGEEVFGCTDGSFAEYVCVKAETLVHKPANVSFMEAAAVPLGALTAVQGLRDHGRIEQGQKVLINGASGGVGTYAVQLAKHFGAEVTGVCSTRNVEMVASLGAAHVVDYTTEDFTTNHQAYDLILDLIGNRKISEYKRCLSPSGRYVVASGPKGRVLGPVCHMVKATLAFKIGTRQAKVYIAQQNRADLQLFRDLLASGAMRSVIDTTYSLEEIATALRHLETGHAKGKIIITP